MTWHSEFWSSLKDFSWFQQEFGSLISTIQNSNITWMVGGKIMFIKVLSSARAQQEMRVIHSQAHWKYFAFLPASAELEYAGNYQLSSVVESVFQLLLVLRLLSSRDISLMRDEDIFILMSFAYSAKTCELELADLHLTGGCQHISGFFEFKLFTVRPYWLLQKLWPLLFISHNLVYLLLWRKS